MTPPNKIYRGYSIEPCDGGRVWVVKDGETKLCDNEDAARKWIDAERTRLFNAHLEQIGKPVIVHVDTIEQAFDVLRKWQ